MPAKKRPLLERMARARKLKRIRTERKVTKSRHEGIRVLRNISAIRRFRQEAKGKAVTRLGFGKEENRAFEHVAGLMRKSGLSVRTDAFGNLYGRLEGKSSKVVMVGSHLDSVRRGGAFDGVYGVTAALEALNNIKATGNPAHPIDLVVWRCEESARFNKAMLGSNAALGKLTAEDLIRTDANGVTLRKALEQNGLTYKPGQQLINPQNVLLYIEPHVEQGDILARAKRKRIGIVTRIAGPERYELTFKSHSAHSGATPMGRRHRKDANVAASKATVKTRNLALRANHISRILGPTVSQAVHKGPIVGTVTQMRTVQGSLNTIPGMVRTTLDVRALSTHQRGKLAKRIITGVRKAALKEGVSLDVKELSRSPPVSMSAKNVTLLERVCRENGIVHRKMPSGAGHDASNLQKAGIPSAMFFVPSEGGFAHNPHERTHIKDLGAGVVLLTKFLHGVAKVSPVN
ncbi:MAG: hypothetical protein CL943_03990 [Candidatus Diapherotrites archaeon]|uniref:Zn-dependent hydrolase n=1 Tax=Candidatus Iainarchaeum sp. TaxID=3101447 RepID=A0A2D6M1Y2_9ARCH|nr:hypothetical protein [Candidatus Diapherotrites archaeon]